MPPKAIEKKIRDTWDFGDRAVVGVRDRVYIRYNAAAVSKESGTGWEVAIGVTPDDRDDAVDGWSKDGEEVRTVPHEHFDGFEGDTPRTK